MESGKTVLIVQENPKLLRLITGCIDNNFPTSSCSTINRAFNYVDQRHFDLIILDTKYQTGNPYELCRRIKIETESKVIFVSSRSEIEIKQKSFENGGDDFLSMPFYPQELSLRINRLLNKYDPNLILTSSQKGILLDSKSKTVKVQNCCVNLSPTEYLIMEYLLKKDRPFNSIGITGYIESRKQKSVTNGSVIVQIKRLREKLWRGTGMKIIKTRYGLGYYIGL